MGDQIVYAAVQSWAVQLDEKFRCTCGTAWEDYGMYGMAAVGECNVACGGNSTQKCGGKGRNTVYRLSKY